MSTGVDGRVPQGFQSYLNPNPDTRRRSNSQAAHLATSPNESSSFSGYSPSTMAQTQRTRYVKTGAIVAFLLMMLLYLSPSRPSVSSLRTGNVFNPHGWAELDLTEVYIQDKHPPILL